MRFKLTIENEDGDTIDMTTSASAGYMIKEIDGLYPPNATISTAPYACRNGSYLNNAFLEKRNLVLSFQMRGTDIETRRQALYETVKTASWVKVTYRTAKTNVYTTGYVETCSISHFTDKTNGQISIICTDPYWHAVQGTVLTATPDDALGNFHFIAPSDYQPFPIGVFTEDGCAVFRLCNDGEETGFLLTLTSLETLVNLQSLSVSSDRGDTFLLDYGTSNQLVFTNGETLELDTLSGERSVTASIGIITYDLFPYVSSSSAWVTLLHGWNTITVKLLGYADADGGWSANFASYASVSVFSNYTATLSFAPCFLGV